MIKTGDLVLYSNGRGASNLWFCQHDDDQKVMLTCICDKHGNLMDPEPQAISIPLTDPTYQSLQKIAWNGPEQAKLMTGRPWPSWVMHIQTQASTYKPSVSTGYPLGTMILGSGSAGNVWIVDKDNTLEVAQLYSGKKKAYLTGSTRDKLTGSNHNILTMKQMLAIDPAFPRWAKLLVNVGHLKAKVPTTAVHPSVIPTLQKGNILPDAKPEKRVEKRAIDLLRERCDHRFLLYEGYTESYEYCSHCDVKRPVQH